MVASFSGIPGERFVLFQNAYFIKLYHVVFLLVNMHSVMYLLSGKPSKNRQSEQLHAVGENTVLANLPPSTNAFPS
ncbi:hypothetical protein DVDV_1555 [Desulfovibrio sp. DV]|nr:hypothetical protein DVDV_1555 [Desulfovibrio sp. DV]